MALPTSGPLALTDIQTEFGGSNPISLNEYYAGGSYVPAGTSGTNGAVPSLGEISIANFYGTTNFTLAFNNGDAFNCQSGSGATSTTATITINTNASISKYGNSSNSGPTAWGSPSIGGIGSSYEFRVIMSFLYVYSDYSDATFTVAGVSYTSATTTPWYTISSNRLMEAFSGYGESNSYGTIEIRNISTLATISRGYDLVATGSPP